MNRYSVYCNKLLSIYLISHGSPEVESSDHDRKVAGSIPHTGTFFLLFFKNNINNIKLNTNITEEHILFSEKKEI